MAGLEAMASGIPLIAADNRGTREYLIDQENGLVCNAASADEFAKAILSLYEIKNKDNDMPQGRRIQLKNFHSMSLRQNESDLPETAEGTGSYYRK